MRSVTQFPWWYELYLTMWRTLSASTLACSASPSFPARRAKCRKGPCWIKVRLIVILVCFGGPESLEKGICVSNDCSNSWRGQNPSSLFSSIRWVEWSVRRFMKALPSCSCDERWFYFIFFPKICHVFQPAITRPFPPQNHFSVQTLPQPLWADTCDHSEVYFVREARIYSQFNRSFRI